MIDLHMIMLVYRNIIIFVYVRRSTYDFVAKGPVGPIALGI